MNLDFLKMARLRPRNDPLRASQSREISCVNGFVKRIAEKLISWAEFLSMEGHYQIQCDKG